MEDGYDFFTSGSTGNAKPIHKTGASLDADVDELIQTFSSVLEQHPIIVPTIQRHHMFGKLWCDLIPKKTGCEVYPGTVISVEQLIAVCKKYPKIIFASTPSFFEKLIKHPDRMSIPPSVIGIISSGSLLRGPVSEGVKKCLGVSPIEIYGSTEAGSVGWRQQENGPIWNVFEHVTVSCLEDHRLVADSVFCLSRPWVMSDEADLLDPRHFLLKGRTDRKVKILEQMVSLPEIEQELEKHPFVEKAHAIASDESIPRIWALVVLTPEGKANLRQGTYAGMIRTLNQSLAPRLPAVAFPRRMRFLREMPFNPQGKLPRVNVLPVLKSKLQEPVIEEWREREDEITALLTFPPDSIVFQGHFPTFPLLPGVAQLYWVQKFLRQCYPNEFSPVKIHRLKFQRIIRPGQTIHLQIRKIDSTKFEFQMCDESGERASSGVFENGEV